MSALSTTELLLGVVLGLELAVLGETFESSVPNAQGVGRSIGLPLVGVPLLERVPGLMRAVRGRALLEQAPIEIQPS